MYLEKIGATDTALAKTLLAARSWADYKGSEPLHFVEGQVTDANKSELLLRIGHELCSLGAMGRCVLAEPDVYELHRSQSFVQYAAKPMREFSRAARTGIVTQSGAVGGE